MSDGFDPKTAIDGFGPMDPEAKGLSDAVVLFEAMKDLESYSTAKRAVEGMDAKTLRWIVLHKLLDFKQQQAKHGVISWDEYGEWGGS